MLRLGVPVLAFNFVHIELFYYAQFPVFDFFFFGLFIGMDGVAFNVVYIELFYLDQLPVSDFFFVGLFIGMDGERVFERAAFLSNTVLHDLHFNRIPDDLIVASLFSLLLLIRHLKIVLEGRLFFQFRRAVA